MKIFIASIVLLIDSSLILAQVPVDIDAEAAVLFASLHTQFGQISNAADSQFHVVANQVNYANLNAKNQFGSTLRTLGDQSLAAQADTAFTSKMDYLSFVVNSETSLVEESFVNSEKQFTHSIQNTVDSVKSAIARNNQAITCWTDHKSEIDYLITFACQSIQLSYSPALGNMAAPTGSAVIQIGELVPENKSLQFYQDNYSSIIAQHSVINNDFNGLIFSTATAVRSGINEASVTSLVYYQSTHSRIEVCLNNH